MGYINVGALDRKGEPVKTKKALKELLAANHYSINFYGTSHIESFYGFATEIPEGTKLSVVGPDPERDRRWYATVERVGAEIKVT